MTASFNGVLSSPAWTAAASILAVVAIIISVVLYRRGRARKALMCSFSDTPLVSVRSEAKDEIQILYAGEPVTGVHLISFSLANVGNVPILESDYESPIVLNLGPTAVPLNVETKEAVPPDLAPHGT